jgi:hypothetical protein
MLVALEGSIAIGGKIASVEHTYGRISDYKRYLYLSYSFVTDLLSSST